jgi:hypothetical protein
VPLQADSLWYAPDGTPSTADKLLIQRLEVEAQLVSRQGHSSSLSCGGAAELPPLDLSAAAAGDGAAVSQVPAAFLCPISMQVGCTGDVEGMISCSRVFASSCWMAHRSAGCLPVPISMNVGLRPRCVELFTQQPQQVHVVRVLGYCSNNRCRQKEAMLAGHSIASPPAGEGGGCTRVQLIQ